MSDFLKVDSKSKRSSWNFFLTVMLLAVISGCNSGPPEGSVSGTIRLDPKIVSEARRVRTMFIILSSENGGPPLAVQRLVRTKLPYKFILTKDDAMMQGRPLSGKVKVRVRLDADGQVGPLVRGDFQGESLNAVPVGARDVDIVINQAGTADPPKKAKRTPPAANRPAGPAAPPQQLAQAPQGPTITGTIKVAPGLAKKAAGKPVLFIIARGERPGPPLAVVKVANPRFPLPFTISKQNVMIQGMPFQGKVRITARLDADGNAGRLQPGDMEGQTAKPVAVGSSGVVITVDREAGGGTSQAPKAGGKTITGRVVVAPNLKNKVAGKKVLFIIARGTRPGPPLAVLRIGNPTFPVSFTLSKANVMMPGIPFDGEVRITARLDADGKAGPAGSGDLDGVTPKAVSVGAKNVTITLNKEH